MNAIVLKNNTPLQMSSREIADLCNKEHKNVLVDIRKMLEELELNSADFSAEYKDSTGRTNPCFNLPRRECDILVAGYSVIYRAAIVDRWQELEGIQSFKIPQNFAEALQLAADQAKQLALAAPKIAFVENLVERHTLMTATQVAQKYGMSAIKLNRSLDELGGVYSKSIKRGRAFVQPFLDGGFGEVKQTELGHSQCLFTPSGEVWIHSKLVSEGVI